MADSKKKRKRAPVRLRPLVEMTSIGPGEELVWAAAFANALERESGTRAVDTAHEAVMELRESLEWATRNYGETDLRTRLVKRMVRRRGTK